MRNSLIVLAVLVVLVSNQCKRYNNKANDGVYAFSWLAGHCEYEVQTHKEACDPNLISLWDK